jgi:single-strand DNA-binding protein
MSRGINKVILVGYLGQDPEVRYTQAGDQVTTLSVATGKKWKDKQGNEQESTEWHKCVLWSGLAKIAGQYVKKGHQVYLEGELKTDKWTDKSGQKRYSTIVRCTELVMLGGKP